MGLLNIFSKWKITCIILSPVQKDSELVSLFIQNKTMIIPWAHFILRGPCWTTSTENCLDRFNMKVTFFVIKTRFCCNHGEPCKGWDVADWAIVNWDIAAQANLSSPSQAWLQTDSSGEMLSSSAAGHSLGRVKAFPSPFFSFMCLALGSVTFLPWDRCVCNH